MVSGVNRSHSHSQRCVLALVTVELARFCTPISLADVQIEDWRDLELRPAGVAARSWSTGSTGEYSKPGFADGEPVGVGRGCGNNGFGGVSVVSGPFVPVGAYSPVQWESVG